MTKKEDWHDYYKKQNEKNKKEQEEREEIKLKKEKSKQKLVGIKGWLIVPAIGLVLAPIKATITFFMGISMIQSFAPELISDPKLWLSGSIDILMIIAGIIVAFFFFKKRRSAIKFTIYLMIASILANLIQAFLIASMFNEMDYETIKPFIHASVYGAIWIPYFVKSKRVKNTFTE